MPQSVTLDPRDLVADKAVVLDPGELTLDSAPPVKRSGPQIVADEPAAPPKPPAPKPRGLINTSIPQPVIPQKPPAAGEAFADKPTLAGAAKLLEQPLIDPEGLGKDLEAITPGPFAVHRGVLKALAGFTSPEAIGIGALSGGAAALAEGAGVTTQAGLLAAQTAISGYFATQIARGVIKDVPAAVDAYTNGDYEKLLELGGKDVASGALAVLGVKHAVDMAGDSVFLGRKAIDANFGKGGRFGAPLEPNVEVMPREMRNPGPKRIAEEPAGQTIDLKPEDLEPVPAAPEPVDLKPEEITPEPATGPESPKAGKPDYPTGSTVTVKTARGTQVDVQYAVVDAKDPVVSHDLAGNENPAYPQERQPRDRGRKASQAQIDDIARNLDSKDLGPSYKASDGAPITDPDLVVESGNARTNAIRLAYERYPDRADTYRADVQKQAVELGIDPKSIEGIANPMLVRIRRTNLDPVQFATEANEQSTAAMSATEQATSDAGKLNGDVMRTFQPSESGDIVHAGNREFVRTFMNEIVSPAERARYTAADGSISQEGVTRIRNAVFAKAYGETSALTKMSESTDSNIRNITSGMLQAAPAIARLEDGISKGELHDLSIAPDAAAAAGKMSSLRENGGSVADYLNQEALFDSDLSPEARTMVQAFDRHGRSAKRIGAILNSYADAVEAAGSPKQVSLFGDGVKPSKLDLIEAAVRTVEESYGTEAKAPAVPVEVRQNEPARRPDHHAADERSQSPARSPAPRGRSENAGAVEPIRLPAILAGAQPRFNHGLKAFTLDFVSDIDKAAYITAQIKGSKADSAYLKFAMKATRLPEAAIRAHGAAVKMAIKAMAEKAAPGELRIPAQKLAVRRGIRDESGSVPIGSGDEESLFSDEEQTRSRKEADSNDAKLEGERLTAQFKSGMQIRPGKRSKAEAQTSLFEETPEEKQGGLFGDERGSVSNKARPKPAEPSEDESAWASVRALKAKRDAALAELERAKTTPGEQRFGQKVIESFTSERDLWAARVNQAIDGLRRIVPKVQDQEALSLMREYRNKPGELVAWRDGTHALDEKVKDKAAARKNIERLRPAIDRALNPTPAMIRADAKLTNIAGATLKEGQRLGFLESRWTPEEYTPHILHPVGQGEFATPVGDRLGRALGGKIGQYFSFAETRGYPTLLDAVADNVKPKTLNAFDAFTVHGDKFATARATHLLVNQIKDTGVGIVEPDRWKRPEGWVELAQHSGEFSTPQTYTDAAGVAHSVQVPLVVPKYIDDALRPITDPDYLGAVPGFRRVRVFQSYTKAIQLGLSMFHATTENYMALANMGPVGWLKGLRADRASLPFLMGERDFIAHGGTTAIQGRTVEAFKSFEPGSIPTWTDIWRRAPVVRQVDQLAQHLTEFTFGKLQRQFKVTDYSLHKAEWLGKNPNATPEETAVAMASIAKEINATYGGLHWENLGANKATVELARALMLAPDWTFSNIFNVKYSTERGTPAGKLGRRFWMRQLIGGMVATQLLSLALSKKTSKNLTQVYMGKDAKGKDVYQNVFFKGVSGDVINLVHNVGDYGAVQGLARTMAGKAAPAVRAGLQLASNRNYFGQEIVPKGMDPIAGTVRAAVETGKSLAPLPLSGKTLYEMLLGPDAKQFSKAEVATTIFAGTPPRHVSPAKGGRPRPIQSIWDQIKTGQIHEPARRGRPGR